MRSLPDRHYVTNPRKKHALLTAILASGKYGRMFTSVIVPGYLQFTGKQACPDCARRLLSNFLRLEQLFSVRATSSNFFLFEQFLSNFY